VVRGSWCCFVLSVLLLRVFSLLLLLLLFFCSVSSGGAARYFEFLALSSESRQIKGRPSKKQYYVRLGFGRRETTNSTRNIQEYSMYYC